MQLKRVHVTKTKNFDNGQTRPPLVREKAPQQLRLQPGKKLRKGSALRTD
jgi:hypothetical protein